MFAICSPKSCFATWTMACARGLLPQNSNYLTQYIAICKYCNVMPELSQFKAEFFKALAHPLRIRILDELRHGEVGVNDLCARLDAEQSTLSQQLAVLRTRNLVTARKDGLNVLYSIRDPEIFHLLDVARTIFNKHL